jgi:hypothetical protein
MKLPNMKLLKYSITAFILFFITIAAQSQENSKISRRLERVMQTKQKQNHTVWIYFSDKGEYTNKTLKTLEKHLPAKTISRREKNMPVENISNFHDLALNEDYINAIAPFLAKKRRQSRWLNALSAEIKAENIRSVTEFPFVNKIDLVLKTKKDYDTKQASAKQNTAPTHKNRFDYGASFKQNELINIPDAHNQGFSGKGVIICMADAGFNNLSHPAFSTLDTLAAYDFVNNDENVDDEDDLGSGSHGTKTLSIIAGFEEGKLIGPAFGAKYILVKTENTDSETPLEEDNWIAAVEWAEYNYGPDIISTSLGYLDWYDVYDLDGNTAAITRAADIAASYGILIVNSAGNKGNGTTTISTPADGDSVLSVGAVDSLGFRTNFSAVGPTADGRIKPDVMAMGAGVTKAEAHNYGYSAGNGTSYACPLTAGGAALLMEMFPKASAADIFRALKMSADRSQNPDNYYGYGIADITAAAEYMRRPHISHQKLKDTEKLEGPFIIEAQINSYTNLQTGSPVLVYELPGDDPQHVEMQKNESGNYTAEIPGIGEPAVYRYYIKTENSDTTSLLPPTAPNIFFEFTAGPDNSSPIIVHKPIKEYYIQLWKQAQINCRLEDNMGIDLNNSCVEWKINGRAQSNLQLYKTDNNIYTAKINNQQVQIGDIIEYRINAKDLAENPNTSYYPESGFLNFYIISEIGFEANTFSHNWELTGDCDWEIINPGAQESDYSAISGIVQKGQVSDLSLNIDFDETYELLFFKQTTDTDNSTYLRLYLDNNTLAHWNGTSVWSQESFSIPPGKHTLKWSYQNYIKTTDNAFAQIDKIRFQKAVSDRTRMPAADCFKMYPNPARNNLHIKTNTAVIQQAELTDINGRVVYRTSFSEDMNIDISKISKGFYILKISNPENICIKKLIIQ